MTSQATAPAHLSRPAPDEHDPYYARYIDRVPDGAVLDRLAAQRDELAELLAPLDDEAALRRYAPGKWTVKEVLGHIIDAERIFTYRALRIGRSDPTPLAGFEQDPYIAAGRFDRRPLRALLAEWRAVREATLALLEGFEPEAWSRRGTASDAPVTVRALAYISAGHVEHHLAILRERYGLGA